MTQHFVGPPRGLCDDSLFCSSWADASRPLYELQIGTENMTPLLYSIIRFVKPAKVLEVGAGFTIIFALQALQDNDAEIDMIRSAVSMLCNIVLRLLLSSFCNFCAQASGHTRVYLLQHATRKCHKRHLHLLRNVLKACGCANYQSLQRTKQAACCWYRLLLLHLRQQ
jgi:hypothetical protein